MSRTKVSPCSPIANACNTNETASLVVIKNLFISECVMVNALPLRSCSCRTGMTLPLEPRTLPKRTATERIPLPGRREMINSPSRFVAPMVLVGFTALSEEIKMKRSTPNFKAMSASWAVPRLLFLMASPG